MNFNFYYTWVCIFILVFFVLYFFWFIPEWQSLRIKHKLVNDRRERAPGLSNKIIGGRCYFMRAKIRLIWYSILCSGILIAAQMYVLKDKPLTDVNNVVQTLIGIGINISLILGIRNANGESDSDAWIVKISTFINDKCLLPIVQKERQDYLEFIHKKITDWYRNDNEEIETNPYFCGLIIRIHTEFFAEILSATTIDENESSDKFIRKEKLKDLPQKIIRDYYFEDQNMTVLTQVKELFSDYLDMDNSEMFKVISFLKEHEECCHGKIRSKLKDQISSRVAPTKQKQDNVTDLNKLLKKIVSVGSSYIEEGQV